MDAVALSETDDHIRAVLRHAAGKKTQGRLLPMFEALGLGPRFREDDETGGEISQVYSGLLEPEPEGAFTVTFLDIGYGATYGASREEALLQAKDIL
jgi:hypothetical protein